jgi:hypothetical protein
MELPHLGQHCGYTGCNALGSSYQSVSSIGVMQMIIIFYPPQILSTCGMGV